MNENETTPSKAKPENRLQKALPGFLRWVLVALFSLGLGALVVGLVFYFPTLQNLRKTNLELEHADTTITSKTDQIATLQTEKRTLQKNLDSTTLHMDLLKALAGVRGASLAVTAGDYAGARLSLSQASDALDTLSGLSGADQKDVLAAMQKSAAQASTDMKTDLQSAQPELVQLTNNLTQLEANLFPDP
jgi:hypothetical protein